MNKNNNKTITLDFQIGQRVRLIHDELNTYQIKRIQIEKDEDDVLFVRYEIGLVYADVWI